MQPSLVVTPRLSRRRRPRLLPPVLAAPAALVLLLGAASRADARMLEGKFQATSELARGPLVQDSSRPARGDDNDKARRVSVEARGVALGTVLREIERQGGVTLVYSEEYVPTGRLVTVRGRDADVRTALEKALRGTGVDIWWTGPARISLGPVRSSEVHRVAGSVSGIVLDASSATGLAGATVTAEPVAGAANRVRSRSVVTDDAGRFRIPNVDPGEYVLTARRLGYVPAVQRVTARDGSESTIRFERAVLASRLAEVVTTVTGSQRRAEIGNVIARVAADSVVGRTAVASLGDVLNARAAGVQIVIGGGLTGSSPRVRVRGLNSVSLSNDPLVVVDGARVEASSGGATIGFGRASGRLNDLNPEEIESIEVVKGPAAATLYGTDAANGVLIITTKRGHAGPSRWQLYAEMGQLELTAPYPNNYLSWGHAPGSTQAQQCALVQKAAGQCTIDSLTTFNPLENKETSPLGRGHREQYGIQVSGGADRLAYFVAGEREEETGFLRMPDLDVAQVVAERGGAAVPEEQRRPNALEKTSLRASVSSRLTDRADVSVSVGLISSDVRVPGPTVFSNATSGRGQRDATDRWAFSGPPGAVFGLRNAEDVERFTGSMSGSWRPVTNISARVTTGADISSVALDALQRRGEGPIGTGRDGRRTTSRTGIALYSVDAGASATVSLTPTVGSRTSVGAQFNRRTSQSATLNGARLTPGSETISGAATLTGSEQSSESVVAGAYVEQMLSYRERLFLTGAVRADGGSAFGSRFRTALYPKASVSWLAVQQGGSWVDDLRLRAAYGASGVMPDPTASLQLISLAPVIADGAAATGATLSAVGNADLRPERQAELETGIDAELFDRRLRLELTAYHRRSRDAIITRPLPSEFGIPTRQENIGAVRNRGVEALVTATVLRGDRITWEFSANGAVNQNRLERIGDASAEIGFPSIGLSREGRPLFGLYAIPITRYEDANGDGIIVPSEVTLGDSMVYMGQAMPPRQLTLATSLGLLGGRLRFATQFDHRGGYVLHDNREYARCSTATRNCRAANDPTASLRDQAAAVARNIAPAQTNYGFVGDGSFTRWRELSVTYLIPARVRNAVHARSADITLAGRNLKIFTQYPGVDPEVSANVGVQGREGYSEGALPPPPRYWILRANIGY
jgi:TonB-linked SusC/RagA family outer membrane protein